MERRVCAVQLNITIMKPEAILQSDMLDILFENRNKDYGAYSLRKNYNKRLMQALGGTGLMVCLFILLQGMRSKEQSITYSSLDSVQLITVIIPPEIKTIVEKPKTQQVKPHALVNDSPPVIVPDKKAIDTKMPTVDELDKGTLGNETKAGPPSVDPGPPVVEPVGGGTQPAPVTEPVSTGPLNFAEVMPSFNGDIRKYMLRNLSQPEDIEEGQKIMVRVKFVVTAEGEVTNVEIIQSGRTDLDKEVMRVIKKMPRWKPGMQGGRPVPVYFHLPVTFVSNSE
jgi:periplasmic protein TonB